MLTTTLFSNCMIFRAIRILSDSSADVDYMTSETHKK